MAAFRLLSQAPLALVVLAALLAPGCAVTDSYWSMPVWGSAVRGEDSPLVYSLLPLMMLQNMGESTSSEAALFMIGIPVCASAAIAAALTAVDLVLLPVTVPHDIWLYSIRRKRDRARRSEEFRRVLFEDDPQALAGFLERGEK